MKILALNGSPRGTRSNTWKLTSAFLSGFLRAQPAEVQEVHVCEKTIRPCTGCFACWTRTPGKCCIGDDMAELIPQLLGADVVIWSFPLYYFGIPSHFKALMDRQLPMNLPYMAQSDTGAHPSRWETRAQRHILISTCGFYTAQGNYDAVTAQYDHILGARQYETLFCGQGELFCVSEVRSRTDGYLALVQRAGEEFAHGGITPATKEGLTQLLYPREVFERMANASWDTAGNGAQSESIF